MAISPLPGWRQIYKFCTMFVWSFLAQIDLDPDFASVVKIVVAQMLASRRRLQSTWAPENEQIKLRSAQSLSGTNNVPTKLSDAKFKKSFNTAVRIKFVFYFY